MANEREHTDMSKREQTPGRDHAKGRQMPERNQAERASTCEREKGSWPGESYPARSTQRSSAGQRKNAPRKRAMTSTSANGRPQRNMQPKRKPNAQQDNAYRKNSRRNDDHRETNAERTASSQHDARIAHNAQNTRGNTVINVRFVAAAAVAVILLVVLVSAIRGCAGAGSVDASNSGATVSAGSSAASQAAQTEAANQEAPIDVERYREQVFSWLEDDYANQLMDAAKADDDAAWIVSHIDEYAVDGSSVQYKLLKLAATEPEARSFVRNWPASYPSDQAQQSDSTWSGRIPHLYQWDKRWGYTLYCNTTFALTGCCPTSLAMVYQGLTGASDLSPYDLGVMAAERGYMDTFNGTSTAFLTDCAPALGLNCWQVSVSTEAMISALSAGNVLICNVGPGDFTTGGHFIVLAGLDAAGNVVVNDPFSAERSAVSWSADTIIGQTKALWAYALA